MWQRRRTKSAQPKATTRTSRSDPYRSGFERRIAAALLAAGINFSYETKKVPYRIERTATYLPDFILPNGVCVEAKGRLTSAERSKYIRVKASNPDLDLRFLFQKASNKLNTKSATTYGMWADRNNFKWAEGVVIPSEWVS